MALGIQEQATCDNWTNIRRLLRQKCHNPNHPFDPKVIYVFQRFNSEVNNLRKWTDIFLPERTQKGRENRVARQTLCLFFQLALAGLLWSSGTLAQVPKETQKNDAPDDFERCRIIADEQARLDCLKKLIPQSSGASDANRLPEPWPLVRTPNPQGGPEAVAIMKTADTSRSDPDLAGLLIRCQEKPGFQVVLALVRPIPPRSKRDVLLAAGTTQSTLHAETSGSGTALILPIDATAFTTGPWQGMRELAVTIQDAEGDIHGVIPLDGIAPAMARLSASCPSR
jgi:hypothetical protein